MEQIPKAEAGSQTPSGYDVELLDEGEQVEKGVKYNRIPEQEALTALNALKGRYLPNVVSIEKEEPILGLMEVIFEGVKSGAIPPEQARSVLRALNEKYPA